MEDETREIEVVFEEDELREGPGRLTGRLLKYGEKITHSKGPELFEPRALKWSDETGVVFYDSHSVSPRRPIAIVKPINSDSEARVEFTLPDSQPGRQLADKFRSGALKGLSVEFRSETESKVGGVRRITSAWLTGLAGVARPAYPSATVEVREKDRQQRGVLTWL